MVDKAAAVETAKESAQEPAQQSAQPSAQPSAQEPAQWTISAPTPWDSSSLAGLVSVLREDYEALDTSWLAPGYLALAVHRIGTWVESDGPPRLLRRPAAVLHKILLGYVRSFLGFEIHKSVPIGRRVRFHHQHGVVVSSTCVIGDDCVFHHNVSLVHRRRAESPKNLYTAPQIGSGVNLGTGCVVLGGVRIGDGATIGPNAIVTMDVPPGASVVSQPGRILRIH